MNLNDQVRIEYPAVSQDATYGTPVVTWTTLATTFAEVQDALPSRAEKSGDGIQTATRPARIRMRWRTDVTSAMRLVLLNRGNRILQIVSGPAELGRRKGIEMMAEAFSTAGDAP